jgi:hypothetical protein
MRSTEFLLCVFVCAAVANIIAGSNDNFRAVPEAIPLSIIPSFITSKPSPNNCDEGRQWSSLVRRCVVSIGNNLFSYIKT